MALVVPDVAAAVATLLGSMLAVQSCCCDVQEKMHPSKVDLQQQEA